MDDARLHEWISAVQDELEKRAIKAPPPYWREGDENEYCRPCFDKLFSSDEREGGYCAERDGCTHCETCGKILAYTLTDYGAEEELDYYEDAEWDWNDPDDCYHVAAMLGAWIGMGYWEVKDLPDRERCIKALQNGKNAPVFV